MKQLLLILLLAVFSTSQAQELSRPSSDSLETVFSDKIDSLTTGDINSLFYFADLLDEETKMQLYHVSHSYSYWYLRPIRKQVLYKLQRYTDFQHITLDTFLTKAQFYDYFEKHKDDIHFSPFIQKWIDAPLEEYEISYRLSELPPKTVDFSDIKKVEDFYMAIQERRPQYKSDIPESINKIGALGTPIARAFLFDYISKKILTYDYETSDDRSKRQMRAVANSLLHFEDRETLDTLFSILEKQTGSLYYEAFFSIKVITNFNARTRTQDSTQYKQIYLHLLDSLGSIEAFQQFGFQQLKEYKKADFEAAVDYYGMIFLDRMLPDFIRYRAYKEMLSLKNPKILAYLGAVFDNYFSDSSPFYRNFWDEEQSEVLKIIERLTRMQMQLPEYNSYYEKFTDEWIWVTGSNYGYIRSWYKIYWYQHYEDYVWSEEEQIFKNKKGGFKPFSQLSQWFEQMRSDNPEIAIAAFISITESGIDLATIEEQINLVQDQYGEYSGWINNRALEDDAGEGLIPATQFTQFCQQNNINYQLSESFQPIIDTLLSTELNYAQRYAYENELSKQLSHSDVNALERLGMIYQTYSYSFSASVGRILDIWYFYNFENVVQTDEQIIWYLKKSEILSGVTEHHYRKRWKYASAVTIQQLKKIQIATTDTTLKEQINWLLPKDLQIDFSKPKYDLEEIFNHIGEYDIWELDNDRLRLETTADYEFIFQQLDAFDRGDTMNFIFSIIRDNLDKAMIPYLIERTDDYRLIYKGYQSYHPFNDGFDVYRIVADEVIELLEELNLIEMPSDDTTLEWLVDSIGYFRGAWMIQLTSPNKYLSGYHWRNLWTTDSLGFQHWDAKLYQQRIQDFQRRDGLSADDLNWLFESPFYSDDQYEEILPLLSLLDPCNKITEVDLPDIFINTTVLNLFHGCRYLDESKFRGTFSEISWEEVFPVLLKSIKKQKRKYYFSSYEDLFRYGRTWWQDDYLMSKHTYTILNH